MKTLTQDEIMALRRVKEDVDTTIDNKFKGFDEKVLKNLKSLSAIFVALFFRSLNHDPKNKDWKNRDYVFTTNNYANIVKNIVKVHAGYANFSEIENYLKEHTFNKSENTFGDAIGHYTLARDVGDKHERFYYVVVSGLDLLNNISALEFILKNKMKRIVIIAYTDTDYESITKENKLSGRLLNLGFDTLVINGESPEYLFDSIIYAKKLEKPSVILANIK
jgi:transketolase N-terminal domain/subunit